MALDANDMKYLSGEFLGMRDHIDKKVDVVHGRISDHEKAYPHHKLLNGRNGNGGSVQSFPAVEPDTFRSGSMGMLKLWSLILGVIVGTAGFLAVLQKFMGG